MQNEKEGHKRKKGDDISERLPEFSARIGKVVDALPDTRLGRHIAGQMIRCGTSPYPNYEEARAAESPADFIHKLRVCLKELRESRSWLNVIIRSAMLSEQSLLDLLDECEQLGNIIGSSVLTATRNNERAR